MSYFTVPVSALSLPLCRCLCLSLSPQLLSQISIKNYPELVLLLNEGEENSLA